MCARTRIRCAHPVVGFVLLSTAIIVTPCESTAHEHTVHPCDHYVTAEERCGNFSRFLMGVSPLAPLERFVRPCTVLTKSRARAAVLFSFHHAAAAAHCRNSRIKKKKTPLIIRICDLDPPPPSRRVSKSNATNIVIARQAPRNRPTCLIVVSVKSIYRLNNSINPFLPA